MSRLLVPVALDVLVVRERGGRFADVAMAEPGADDVEHRDLWPAPFRELAGGREQGAYLHWALPDALTHARSDAEGNLSFHAIPDRWLVVRVAPSTTGRRAARAWVLESDRAVATPLERWRETPRTAVAREPLTALGHGDFAWAAYFDNTVNRLAFHDDLADVPAGPIAYLVCGWYASSERDPIADPAVVTNAATHVRLDELRWRIAGAATRATGLRASLYHGSAVDIAWPRPAASSPELGGPPPSSGIRVVVASTTAEAFATLAARSDAEVRLLEAAQLGMLDELGEADGRARLDAVLHASAFGSLAGGEIVERVTQPEPAPDEPPPIVSRPRPDVVVRPFEMATRTFRLADRVREGVFTDARLDAALADEPPADDPPPPAGPVEVRRSLPRFFHPTDPVVLVEGAHRSFKHGGDGRFTTEGVLVCRATGDTLSELAVLDPGGRAARLAIRGAAIFDRPLSHPDVPEECAALLAELGLLDPGSSLAIAEALDAGPTRRADERVRRRVEVEQTAWWATRDTRIDPGAIVALSGFAGTLPSPLAVTSARRPWNPIHLEWRAEYAHAARAPRGYVLGETDLAPDAPELDAPITLEGRMLLTPAAAGLAAATARRTLRKAVKIGTSASLEAGVQLRFASSVAAALDERLGTLSVGGDETVDPASAFADLDVLSGTLDPLHAELGKRFAIRGGALTLTRLRIVDGFGQFVDLVGDDGRARMIVAETLREPDAGESARVALVPRLLAPARLWLRYVDGAGGETLASSTVSPVAGYLLPHHLDDSLEIMDADGRSQGALRPADDGGLIFESAPGIVTRLGARPAEAIANPVLAGIAEALLDWGAADASSERSEGVLSALLRLVDATRWSCDPRAHGSNEDLGPLVGRPIAVLRARVWLELAEPDERLARSELALRLGSIADLDDGLHGAFVGGDYRALLVSGAAADLARETGPGRGYLQQAPLVAAFHARFADDVAAGGATPVVHPYLARDREILLTPGAPIELGLLVEPYALVHATTGFLPRKEIGMRREWLAAGLARLAPTFRFGPVLVDPQRIRLPVAREIAGTWTWAHRIDESAWSESEVIDAAAETAAIGETVRAHEGWLRFTPEEEDG